MTKICKFCDILPATQKHSHIFTKSLSKSMRFYKGEVKLYKIDSGGNKIKCKSIQDTPKEDFIFCPKCEHEEFGHKIETPIINRFYKDFYTNNNFIYVIYNRKFLYRAYWGIDYILFKKFVYLQLYRAHISELDYFKDINLSQAQYTILKDSLKDDFTDLDILILTCDSIEEKSENIQMGTFLNSDNFLLWINEFVYVICFDKINRTKFINQFEEGISTNGTIRIVMQSKNQWKLLKKSLF